MYIGSNAIFRIIEFKGYRVLEFKGYKVLEIKRKKSFGIDNYL